MTDKNTVSVDIEQYQRYLDNSVLTDDEKRLFVESMWYIVSQCVMLGWDIHPVQEACGKHAVSVSDSALPEESMVHSLHHELLLPPDKQKAVCAASNQAEKG